MSEPSFRELMDIWDENIFSQRKQSIQQLINDELMFFFKRDGDIYGCPEESRLIFAKLKNPDEDVNDAWDTEASFLAYNLSRGLKEDNVPKRLFYKKDINGLKLIDKEKVMKEL